MGGDSHGCSGTCVAAQTEMGRGRPNMWVPQRRTGGDDGTAGDPEGSDPGRRRDRRGAAGSAPHREHPGHACRMGRALHRAPARRNPEQAEAEEPAP